MAAVLRVKRKRGAEPAEALLISCKRPRVQEGGAVSTQLFRLAATVTSQDESVQKYVQEAISRDHASQAHHPRIGSLQRIQKDMRAQRDNERQKSRYRLVSSLRPKCDEVDGTSDTSQPASPAEEHVPAQAEASTKDQTLSKSEKEETFQVLDVVQEEADKEAVDVKASDPETILCNSVAMIRESLTVSQEGEGSQHRENPQEFVYDIYYAAVSSSQPNWIQGILSVQAYYEETPLEVDDDNEPDEVYEDEDDENEESNWRNDYPDEEDEESSDREERYMGYYEDSDEDAEHGRGHAWEAYRQRTLRECEHDDEED